MRVVMMEDTTMGSYGLCTREGDFISEQDVIDLLLCPLSLNASSNTSNKMTCWCEQHNSFFL